MSSLPNFNHWIRKNPSYNPERIFHPNSTNVKDPEQARMHDEWQQFMQDPEAINCKDNSKNNTPEFYAVSLVAYMMPHNLLSILKAGANIHTKEPLEYGFATNLFQRAQLHTFREVLNYLKEKDELSVFERTNEKKQNFLMHMLSKPHSRFLNSNSASRLVGLLKYCPNVLHQKDKAGNNCLQIMMMNRSIPQQDIENILEFGFLRFDLGKALTNRNNRSQDFMGLLANRGFKMKPSLKTMLDNAYLNQTIQKDTSHKEHMLPYAQNAVTTDSSVKKPKIL